MYARNQLENQLDINWGNGSGSGDVKCALSSKTFDTSFNQPAGNGIVVAASEKYVVIGPGPAEGGKTKWRKELAVVDMETEEIWQLDESMLFGGETDIEMEVFIDNNILAVWLNDQRSKAQLFTNISWSNITAVKVFSTRMREVLFEEDCLIHDIVFDSISSSSLLSRLIHIREDRVEMLCFNDNALVSRFSFPQEFEGGKGFLSSVFPHILYCQFPRSRWDEGEVKAVFVWKVDEENEQIVMHKYPPYPHNFAVRREVLFDAIYVSSSFVVSTGNIQAFPVDFDRWTDQVEVWSQVENCVIKILNDDGQLIRELELDSYQSGHMNTKLHLHRNWLLVERLRDFIIFKFDMEQLLNLDACDNVSFKRLEFGQEKDRFYKIILSKTSIGSALVDYRDAKLKLRRLDFWAID